VNNRAALESLSKEIDSIKQGLQILKKQLHLADEEEILMEKIRAEFKHRNKIVHDQIQEFQTSYLSKYSNLQKQLKNLQSIAREVKV